jgi:hypothetical protein
VTGAVRLTLGHAKPLSSYRDGLMSWLVILLAAIGAALILGALAFVSTLLGVVITSMIILMCGPLIDRLLARRTRRPT